MPIGKHSRVGVVPKPMILSRVNFRLLPDTFIAPTIPWVALAQSVPKSRSNAWWTG